MFNEKIFSKNLDTLIKAKNWTAYKFAKELGIYQSTVSRWKSGERFPSMDIIWKIADLFGISMDQLVGREPLPDWVKKGKHD